MLGRDPVEENIPPECQFILDLSCGTEEGENIDVFRECVLVRMQLGVWDRGLIYHEVRVRENLGREIEIVRNPEPRADTP